MKRFLLVLLLLCGVLDSRQAEASGSNTVFMPVRSGDYFFVSALNDDAFNTSKLYDFLESAQSNQVMVARVNPYIYRTTYYYTYWGYEMRLGFHQYEIVSFQYYPNFDAIIGVTSNEEIVVLLPQIPSKPSFGEGILHN